MKLIAKTVDLEKMDKYELSNLNKEIVAELEWINANIKRTTEEETTINEQITIIQTLMKNEFNKQNALVPLTPSLFAKGTIEYTGRIIIPIGNNFFIDKRIDKALEIYQNRLKEKQKEKRGFELLLNDRTTVLKRMEAIIKRLVTIEKIVLSKK